LVVNLQRSSSDSGLVFRRDLYASSIRKRVREFPRASIKDWTLAVLGKEPTGDKRLQLMTTLEKDRVPVSTAVSLTQFKPGFAWFQVTAGDKATPVPGVRVTPLPRYPAPAWSIETLQPWPAGESVNLEAWWHDDDPKSAGQLRRDRDDFQTLDDLTGKEVELVDQEPVKVTVEKVYYESRKVERPLDGDKNDVDCLIVRLRYPPGKPFFVRLPEAPQNLVGYEHRFFAQAGRYTGIFWNVSREDVRALRSLEFVSVEAAKRQATYFQDKLKLGTSTWVRPQRPNE
jgi:hypothetical protein